MNGNPLLDAETTLVGWTNRSAIRNHEHTFLSGEEVLLNTKLDAASRFSLVVSHPGADSPVEVELLLAPVLRDGTTGSWISAATVALPAEGGRVEAFLSGRDLQLNAADLADVDLPAVCFAKALVSPATPEGMHVGLTATIAA
jgi:hypothetical protein